MPNHCENELVIFCNYKQAEDIWAAIASGDKLDFGGIIPCPQEFNDLDDTYKSRMTDWRDGGENGPRPKDGFNSGGYEWCCESWGTKWNAYDVVIVRAPSEEEAEDYGDDDHFSIVVQFQTAWTPPLPVFKALSARWPDANVSLQFWERGAGYQGLTRWIGGKTAEEFQTSYYGHRGG